MPYHNSENSFDLVTPKRVLRTPLRTFGWPTSSSVSLFQNINDRNEGQNQGVVFIYFNHGQLCLRRRCKNISQGKKAEDRRGWPLLLGCWSPVGSEDHRGEKCSYLDTTKVFTCGRNELLLWVTAPWSAPALTYLVVNSRQPWQNLGERSLRPREP